MINESSTSSASVQITAGSIKARLNDHELEWMTQLARKHRNELGALHCGRIQTISKERDGWVRAIEVNDDLAGLIVARLNSQADERLAYIVGAAIPEDARRRRLAESLVEDFIRQAARTSKTIVQAICRCDLAANSFWSACGFVPCFARNTFATRGHKSIVWRRPSGTLPVDLLDYRPPLRPRLSGGRYAAKASKIWQQTLWPGDNTHDAKVEQITNDPAAVFDLLEVAPMTTAERVAAITRRTEAANA